MSAWTDLVDAMRTVRQTKQLVICEPHMVQQVDTLIQRYDMGHCWRAAPSAHCPKGKLILVRDMDLPDPAPEPPEGMLF